MLESTTMLPSISNQSGESSVLRRLLGSSGNSSAPLGKNLSPERRKAQQAVLDSMLDPCSVEGMAAMEVQEPHRSSCFANLQKLRAELANTPMLPASPHDLCNSNTGGRIITVQEMKQTELEESNNDALTEVKDRRPLKSLHWKALGNKRHHCEGNSSNCEKCRRVMEVKKATQRFEAKRVAKQALQESRADAKALEEAKCEAPEGEQRIKRKEGFCRFAVPNARTVVQRSKSASIEDISLFPIGGNCKWAQSVLTEFPKEQSFDYNELIDSEEFDLKRYQRNIPSCLSELKFVREYMDDEPDFESEKIASWELAPKSQTNIVFIPPNWCEWKCVSPPPPEPRIRIIDTSCGESDAFSNSTESRGLASLRKLIPGKSQVTEVIQLKDTINTTRWNEVVMTLEELDEKGNVQSDFEFEEITVC